MFSVRYEKRNGDSSESVEVQVESSSADAINAFKSVCAIFDLSPPQKLRETAPADLHTISSPKRESK